MREFACDPTANTDQAGRCAGVSIVARRASRPSARGCSGTGSSCSSTCSDYTSASCS